MNEKSNGERGKMKLPPDTVICENPRCGERIELFSWGECACKIEPNPGKELDVAGNFFVSSPQGFETNSISAGNETTNGKRTRSGKRN